MACFQQDTTEITVPIDGGSALRFLDYSQARRSPQRREMELSSPLVWEGFRILSNTSTEEAGRTHSWEYKLLCCSPAFPPPSGETPNKLLSKPQVHYLQNANKITVISGGYLISICVHLWTVFGTWHILCIFLQIVRARGKQTLQALFWAGYWDGSHLLLRELRLGDAQQLGPERWGWDPNPSFSYLGDSVLNICVRFFDL